MFDTTPTQALIYCRVSSTKQKLSGGGLESQEHRCRQYAEAKGYDVAAVFPDDASGGGTFMKRPGMVALLSFLDAQPEKNFAVIFDDLKRFARDTQFHIMLRNELSARGAKVECLNFTFEDTPEGRFAETIFAAQGELEREQNRRQTLQKMRARIEKGYWVFSAPIGYRYQRSREHGKLLVRDEPAASSVQEALEGYASGRFQTPTEVRRFLQKHPQHPKNTIHPQRIHDMLTRPVYAGMVEAPSWGISLRQGFHEPLISYETYCQIQDRLNGKPTAPMRVDIDEAFPLRGFLLCEDCGKPMTACFSTSQTGAKHPYYWCKTKGCPSHRKSIRRAKVEEDFEAFLGTLQPTKGFFDLLQRMFSDAWAARSALENMSREDAKRQLVKLDGQIANLVERIMDSSQPAVIAAYEKKISTLEQEKLVMKERIAKPQEEKTRKGTYYELALAFLSSPQRIWQEGNFAWKRIVLRLAFMEPIIYSREKGIRTPKTTLPFKALEVFDREKCEMARWGGFEPPTP
ncbi:recombinase family protein [Celeribacter ethanolicus]|uniref:recombinase family protein n=1 Tax=Celeribacter ethanolicus TaxID=1758178 RepID=UPI0009D74CEC|nr:recombinase family protein [Celeribacter ethanolicus]